MRRLHAIWQSTPCRCSVCCLGHARDEAAVAIVSSAFLIHAQKLPVSPLAAPGGALVSHIPVRWLLELVG